MRPQCIYTATRCNVGDFVEAARTGHRHCQPPPADCKNTFEWPESLTRLECREPIARVESVNLVSCYMVAAAAATNDTQ
jgi:hypothetical protein